MSPAELTLKRDELTERLKEIRHELAIEPDEDSDNPVAQEERYTHLLENAKTLESRLEEIQQRLAALDDEDEGK